MEKQRDIVKYPNEILLKRAEEVILDEVKSFKSLIDDMITIVWKGASGLSAPQINVSKRIIVYIGNNKEVEVLINPRITHFQGTAVSQQEGCLSVPNIRRNIKRLRNIVVKGWDRKGKPITIIPKTNFIGFIIQHEIDHLNGILILNGAKERNLVRLEEAKDYKCH